MNPKSKASIVARFVYNLSFFLTSTIAPRSEIFITDEFHVEEVDLRAVDAEAVPARDIVVQRTK